MMRKYFLIMNIFPVEIIYRIMKILPTKDIASLAKTNSRIYLLCKDEALWKELCQRDGLKFLYGTKEHLMIEYRKYFTAKRKILSFYHDIKDGIFSYVPVYTMNIADLSKKIDLLDLKELQYYVEISFSQEYKYLAFFLSVFNYLYVECELHVVLCEKKPKNCEKELERFCKRVITYDMDLNKICNILHKIYYHELAL